MTNLKEQLHTDLTAAIKAKDSLTSGTLRMVLAAITNEEVSGKEARVLNDQDMITVLNREAKKRKEAATAYDEAKRPELADKERAELGIIQAYLPAALSEEDLAKRAQAVKDNPEMKGWGERNGKDPEFDAKRIEGIRAAQPKRAEKMRDPVALAQRKERLKATLNSPEYKAKRALLDTPEYRAKLSEAKRAYWASKRLVGTAPSHA